MKTSRQTKIKVAVITLLSATIMTMVACKKSGSGGSTAVQQTWGVGCTNCFTNAVILLDAVQSKSFSDEINFNFDLLGDGAVNVTGLNGQVSTQAYIDPLDAMAYLRYNGKSIAHGYMNINDYTIGTCNAPIGEYYFKPLSTGNFRSGVLGSSKMEAINGATRVVFNIVSATFYSRTGVPSDLYRGSGQNAAGLNIVFESVNGQPCSNAGVGIATF